MAVAELFLFRPACHAGRETGQSPVDYGLRERAGARRYCLLPFKAED